MIVKRLVNFTLFQRGERGKKTKREGGREREREREGKRERVAAG